eukprot:9451776-Pyramimonas_sp.AAC.1
MAYYGLNRCLRSDGSSNTTGNASAVASAVASAAASSVAPAVASAVVLGVLRSFNSRVLLLHFAGPPVPMTAGVLSTSRKTK